MAAPLAPALAILLGEVLLGATPSLAPLATARSIGLASPSGGASVLRTWWAPVLPPDTVHDGNVVLSLGAAVVVAVVVVALILLMLILKVVEVVVPVKVVVVAIIVVRIVVK